MDYTKHFSAKKTPQTQAIPGKKMIKNAAGGFGFKVSPMHQLGRFLILGTEGGSYYAGEHEMTIDNATNLVATIKNEGVRVVDKILEISDSGRAPKNNAALFALAVCTAPEIADVETRRAAFKALPKIARISTHLFQFIDYMKHFRGFGKLAQQGVQDWYQLKDAKQLEFQMVKYRQRLGWTHNDVLRLAKPVPISHEHDQLYEFAKNGVIESEHQFNLIEGFIRIQQAETVKEAVKLISDFRLPMETVPTQFKKDPAIWEALLPQLPITATIRNLRNMAKSGFLTQFSDASKTVADRIASPEGIRKGRVHPIQFLNAILNYPIGKVRLVGSAFGNIGHAVDSEFPVCTNVTEALNEGFHLGFGNVTPSNKNTMLALDISGSMGWNWAIGMKGITPAEASAAMALITVNVEPNHMIGVFEGTFKPFNKIKKGMQVDAAVKALKGLPFGGTDLASPIYWALANKVPVDMFQCYTDNETWAGSIHPSQALDNFCAKMGRPAKFASVAMTATENSVADPNNPQMLDVIGFDTATPEILSRFAEM